MTGSGKRMPMKKINKKAHTAMWTRKNKSNSILNGTFNKIK
ncbi:hypothetical protein rho14_38 [Bacillus phage rho14]|nr:hypothetical protein rho14_38 [Bacillus phage rho14]